MNSMECAAKGCTEDRGVWLRHPKGGEVQLCAKHYDILQRTQDILILSWIEGA